MLRATGMNRSAAILTLFTGVWAVGLSGCAVATEAAADAATEVATVQASEVATEDAHLTIETRDIDPTGETDLQQVFDAHVVEGQVITVELAGSDVDLTITSVHPDGIEISLGAPLAATDRDGVHSAALVEDVDLTTAEPSVHLWTPTLDSGTDIVVTLH